MNKLVGKFYEIDYNNFTKVYRLERRNITSFQIKKFRVERAEYVVSVYFIVNDGYDEYMENVNFDLTVEQVKQLITLSLTKSSPRSNFKWVKQ